MAENNPNHDAINRLTEEEASREIHSRRKVRYGTACWPCRQRKVKCDKDIPCQNCIKREHPQLCLYGRRIAAGSSSVQSDWPTQTVQKSNPVTQFAESRTTSSSLLDTQVPSLVPWHPEQVAGSAQEIHDAAQNSASNSTTWLSEIDMSSSESPENHIPRQKQTLNADDGGSFIPAAFVSLAEDTRALSLDTALDPSRRLEGHQRQDTPTKALSRFEAHADQEDPVILGLVNRHSAQHLYDSFLAYFDYHGGFLDPKLYTFSYTRSNSSFLFTVLLLIASRVFRPDLCPLLRGHAEMLLGRTLLSCDTAVASIWAIVCMYYWKDMGDTRGYTLIGFAMRLAVSSDWNARSRRRLKLGRSQSPQTNETELQSRKCRDQDRLWLFLSSIDRTLSLFTDRPLTTLLVPKDISRDWLNNGGNGTYEFGDARAIAGLELSSITGPVYNFILATRDNITTPENREQDEKYCVEAMAKFNDDMKVWGDYWGPVFATYQSSTPSLEPQVYIYRDHLRTYFNSIYLHRILISTSYDFSDPAARLAIETCYSTTISLLEEAAKLARMDVLYYLWDVAHLMIGYSAMVLLKILKQAPENTAVSLPHSFAVLRDLADLHIAAAASLGTEANNPSHGRRDDHASNTVVAQARLLRTIVSRLKTELLPAEASLESMGEPNEITGDTGAPALNETAWELSAAAIPPMMAAQQKAPDSVFMSDEQNAELINNLSIPMADPFATAVADEMDFALDANMFDSRFGDAGLVSWDTPGIFIDLK